MQNHKWQVRSSRCNRHSSKFRWRSHWYNYHGRCSGRITAGNLLMEKKHFDEENDPFNPHLFNNHVHFKLSKLPNQPLNYYCFTLLCPKLYCISFMPLNKLKCKLLALLAIFVVWSNGMEGQNCPPTKKWMDSELLAFIPLFLIESPLFNLKSYEILQA